MPMLPTQNDVEAGAAPDGGRRPTVVAAPASASPELTARPRRRTFTARGGDARHVALVEQRELQGAAVQHVLDRRSAQCGDPVQTCGSDVLGDARLSDHAAIADQHHMAEAEALLELVDLRCQRRRIRALQT
jgi:hypothetical protein